MSHKADIFFENAWKDICLIAIGASPFLLTTILLFLKSPLPWPDEAIFLNTAQILHKTGVLATSLFGSAIFGLDKHALWYPPLYFYLLSYWTTLFGSSIEAIRMLSVFLATASLTVCFYLFKLLFKTRLLAFFGVLFIAADCAFSQAGRVARMDMLSFFFLVTALYSYFLVAGRRSIFYAIPGLFASLAMFSHPLGFIAPVIIAFHMFISNIQVLEKGKKILAFALPILLTQLAWILSIKQFLGLLAIQYGLQIARKAGEDPFAIVLLKTNLAWEIILICYIAIVGIFISNHILKNRTQKSIFFLVGFSISFFALMWGKEIWYFLYFQPFITLLYLSLFQNNNQKETLQRDLLIAVGVVLFSTQIFLTFSKAVASDDYHAFTEVLRHALPTKASLFLATIPDPYFDLVKNTQFTFYEFPTVPISNTAYSQLLDKADYIIINFPASSFIEQYILLNQQSSDSMQIQSGEYGAQIVKLTARNKRKRII